MSEVRLAPEAVDELNEAATWYEKRSEGLGTELLEEVEEVLQRIGALRESFPQLASRRSPRTATVGHEENVVRLPTQKLSAQR